MKSLLNLVLFTGLLMNGVSAMAASEAASAPPASGPANVTKLTLDDSIHRALKGATSILGAEADQAAAGTQMVQSYLQFLPNLTVQGGYTYSKGETYLSQAVPTLVNGSNYGPSYQISTTLNIFNGLSDLAAWKSSNERKAAADKTLHRARQQISLDIAQSYLQVVLDQRIVAIAEKNLKASQDRQTLLEEQTKVGVRNMSDLFRQQAQTSSDESYLITSQNKQQTDLILLLRKLRYSPDEGFEVAEPPLEEQVAKWESVTKNQPEDQMINEALKNRQDYEVAKLTAEAADWDVTSLRGSYFPRLDFVAGYGSIARHFDYQFVNGVDQTPPTQVPLDTQLRDQTGYTYGLMLTWTLFDRWVTTAAVSKGKATALKSRYNEEDYHRQVIGEVKQALFDYKAAVQQLETSRKGLTAAQKAYEVSEGRYEVGSMNYVDLAVAQTALVQAEASRAQALINYEMQKRSIDFALGTTAVE